MFTRSILLPARSSAFYFARPHAWHQSASQKASVHKWSFRPGALIHPRFIHKVQHTDQKMSIVRHGFGHRRLRVLLDMDGVLADFEQHFFDKYREKYPDEPFIPVEKRTTFYVCDQYEKLKPDLREKCSSIWEAEGFFLNLPEIEGACEAAKEMAEMEDVDVFLCSSPLGKYKYCLTEKMQWVEEHLGRDWCKKLILAKDKTMVAGHLLIDDKPYISGVCQPTPWTHAIFSGPYNRNIEQRGRPRLENWTDGQWRELIEDYKKRI